MRRTFCSPMRRISSTHQSAQRLTSPACCGSALMLGIASNPLSSSRYRSRFTLMKSITLSMRSSSLTFQVSRLSVERRHFSVERFLDAARQVSACPSIGLAAHDSLGFELLEMRADVFVRGRQQGRIEPIIDGFGDGLHARPAGAQGIEHLLLAHPAMLEITGEERAWIVDAWAMRRQ